MREVELATQINFNLTRWGIFVACPNYTKKWKT